MREFVCGSALAGLPYLALGPPAWADAEALARHYFTAETEGPGWLEGFAEKAGGDWIAYSSHRDPASPALLVRATDGKDAIEWLTAPVPADWRGRGATFVWAAALGCGSGRRRFDLFVNDRGPVSFVTGTQWEWSVPGRDGCRLDFFAAELNKDGDLSGYLELTVPADRLVPGKPLRLKIVGEAAGSSAWVMLFGFKDAVAHLREHEIKPLYQEFCVTHGAGPSLKVAARPGWHGRAIAVRDDRGPIAAARLEAWGAVSGAYLPLPRPGERALGAAIELLVDGQPVAGGPAPDVARLCTKAFLEERVRAERCVFPAGPFPRLDWERPAAVASELGPVRTEVAYYDAAFRPVQTAVNPGRYGAVLTARLPDGFTVRRYVTLRCATGTASPEPAPAAAEEEDRQWWVAFKRREGGADRRWPPFRRPVAGTEEGPVLRTENPATKGYTRSRLERIRTACRDWAEGGREPLAALVARDGVIVFHEAFGELDGRPMTVDTPTAMASITKWMTGTLMLEFVDQGWVGLDDPVKKFLPDFDRPVAKDPTVRDLFACTAGFIGHGSWGADANPAFENCAAHYLPSLEVARHREYSGDGYVLAGKIMERLSGQATPGLFQERLFGPLGATHTRTPDTAGGSRSVCLDVAAWLQMLLNGGVYGQTRYFSRATFEQMKPVNMEPYVPGLKAEYGIGCTWAGPGRGVLTCGAASGAIARVDLSKKLIVVLCRNRLGARYDEFAGRFLSACASPLAEKTTGR